MALWLLLPGMSYLALFFLTPLFSLVLTSFATIDPLSPTMPPALIYGFDVQAYVDSVSSYLPHILRSFGYALVATILALLISYPLAYYIGVKLRSRPLFQKLMLTVVVAPFFISFLLRTIAWKQLLAIDSPIVQVMQQIGLLGPNEAFIGTSGAVIFGLTYNFIPFMTLPLYTSLERLDIRLIEASGDLYASPATTFRKITLPITMPGVISGTLLTFIPISGDYVNANTNFLGSPSVQMLGNQVEANFLRTANYPVASALSVILMGIILLIVTVYVKRTGTEDLL
ncbi:MAG: ABC transporter permease [Micrococcales bacterium]